MTDLAPPPSSRRRERTRARLLDAAQEVFGEVGMTAASVELISERAGFTRGAFYSNFESKEDLLLALVTRLSEAKVDEVVGRIRALEPSAMRDPAALVRHLVGSSIGDLEPQLSSEIRTQALRDPRLAQAYLTWQDGLRGRIEDIVRSVAERQEVVLRLSVPETAELLLDVSEETCLRAAMEGQSRRQLGALLTQRLERLVAVLVELS